MSAAPIQFAHCGEAVEVQELGRLIQQPGSEKPGTLGLSAVHGGLLK